MPERDVERNVNRDEFVATLRRIADRMESEGSFRIQVQNERFTVPADAELSIEHERDAEEEELELQFRWPVSGKASREED